MLSRHLISFTKRHSYDLMMSSLGQINQRRIKTKISHSNRTGSPLKMLRAHVMAVTQQQYQPPTMSSLRQINQRRIKTKISHSNRTARSDERRVGKESRSRWSPYH